MNTGLGKTSLGTSVGNRSSVTQRRRGGEEPAVDGPALSLTSSS